MCLYEKVTKLCEKKNVTIYRMCLDTGIAQNTVCNWKSRPNAEPDLGNALKMASYFCVDPSHFLGK